MTAGMRENRRCVYRLCHFLWTLFSGFLITRPSMAAGFVWLYYLSGTAYVLYGNAVAQLGNEDRKAIVPGTCRSCSPRLHDWCTAMPLLHEPRLLACTPATDQV